MAAISAVTHTPLQVHVHTRIRFNTKIRVLECHCKSLRNVLTLPPIQFRTYLLIYAPICLLTYRYTYLPMHLPPFLFPSLPTFLRSYFPTYFPMLLLTSSTDQSCYLSLYNPYLSKHRSARLLPIYPLTCFLLRQPPKHTTVRTYLRKAK